MLIVRGVQGSHLLFFFADVYSCVHSLSDLLRVIKREDQITAVTDLFKRPYTPRGLVLFFIIQQLEATP